MTASWPAHRVGERLEVLDVPSTTDEALVAGVRLEVPLPPGGEVVVDGDPLDGGVGEQAVDEVAADEARAADDEPASRFALSLSGATPTSSARPGAPDG